MRTTTSPVSDRRVSPNGLGSPTEPGFRRVSSSDKPAAAPTSVEPYITRVIVPGSACLIAASSSGGVADVPVSASTSDDRSHRPGCARRAASTRCHTAGMR